MKNRDKYREGTHPGLYHKVGIFLTVALIEQTAGFEMRDAGYRIFDQVYIPHPVSRIPHHASRFPKKAFNSSEELIPIFL